MKIKKMNNMSNKYWYIITPIISLIIILFLLEMTGFINYIKYPAQKIFNPVQLALYKTKQDVNNFVNTITQVKTLRQNESKLQIENAELLAENEILKKLEKENKVLREQLGAKKIKQVFITAQVIGSDPLITSNKLLINKGKKDGVKKGNLVLLKDMLIGEIDKVGGSSSSVMLLADPGTKIPGVSKSGVKGLLEGKFGSSIVFTQVEQDQKINVGELLFTSGEADFPQGLVLGTVKKIENNPADIFQKIWVETLIPIESLETVFVAKD